MLPWVFGGELLREPRTLLLTSGAALDVPLTPSELKRILSSGADTVNFTSPSAGDCSIRGQQGRGRGGRVCETRSEWHVQAPPSGSALGALQ